MSPEAALTIEQAADRLLMNKEVLRRWIREGRVPAVKLGRVWRMTESTVDKILTGAIDVSAAPEPAGASKPRTPAAKKKPAKRRK